MAAECEISLTVEGSNENASWGRVFLSKNTSDSNAEAEGHQGKEKIPVIVVSPLSRLPFLCRLRL